MQHPYRLPTVRTPVGPHSHKFHNGDMGASQCVFTMQGFAHHTGEPIMILKLLGLQRLLDQLFDEHWLEPVASPEV
jgi:hypothetical protein